MRIIRQLQITGANNGLSMRTFEINSQFAKYRFTHAHLRFLESNSKYNISTTMKFSDIVVVQICWTLWRPQNFENLISKWQNNYWTRLSQNIAISVSDSKIDYLRLPSVSSSANNWSARHWQITIFCSTSSNNCIVIECVNI